MWFSGTTKVKKKYPADRLQIYIQEVNTEQLNGYGSVELCITQTDALGNLVHTEEQNLTVGSVIYWEKPDDEE